MARDNLTAYQVRVLDGASRATGSGNVLVEAPTGSGKTAMEALLAADFLKANPGRKVLLITHRRVIFGQMVGYKKETGEVALWAGEPCGQIAPPEMGGVNLDHRIVVGMVQTLAPRLEKDPDFLKGFGLVVIDEAHHASADGAQRDDTAAYARVIDTVIDQGGRCAGFTATSYRADGDQLHPAFTACHREIVGYDEAVAAGRIVPVRTILGKAPLDAAARGDAAGYSSAAGAGVVDVWDVMTSGAERMTAARREALEGKVSAAIRKRRGPAFWDGVVSEHERLLSGLKTIVFVDSVAEIEGLCERFENSMGPGVARGIHSDKKAVENQASLKAYGRDRKHGGADILVACKMIDEGFNVPNTDAVVLASVSLSKAQMNQYVGRAVRAAKDKKEAVVVDYGVSTHRHGRIEAQHAVQNVEALSASAQDIKNREALRRFAPKVDISSGIRVMMGERVSLALVEKPSGLFDVYSVECNASIKIDNIERKSRRAPLVQPRKTATDLDTEKVLGLLFSRSRDEAAWFARQGGFGAAYREKCKRHINAICAQIEPWLSSSPAPHPSSALRAHGAGAWSAAMRNDVAGRRWRDKTLATLGAIPVGGERKATVADAAELASAIVVAFSKESDGDAMMKRRARSAVRTVQRALAEKPAGLAVLDYVSGVMGELGSGLGDGVEGRFLAGAGLALGGRHRAARDAALDRAAELAARSPSKARL